MGTPVIIEIVDANTKQEIFDVVFDYFRYVDEKFSTYKDTSEISLINKKILKKSDMSEDMKLIFKLAEVTKRETNGYFDIVKPSGYIDPSGIVKGWSIHNASNLLKDRGIKNFSVEAGGDIETYGLNSDGMFWCVGIQNPFSEIREIVKKVYVSGFGVATSGSYVRGDHIYNPKDKNDNLDSVVSLTVIGPNIYEADRFATAAYAMGDQGIYFIDELQGFEGYSIDKSGKATMTRGFHNFTNNKDTNIYA